MVKAYKNTIYFLPILFSLNALADPLSLKDALNEAEKISPRLTAASLQEEAAAQSVRAARSGYMPSLDLAGIASTGKPGSFPLLGVDSNISSANRVGEGGGLVLRQTIWDFGRTGSAVAEAQSVQGLRGKEKNLQQMELDLEVSASYFRCALFKTEVEDAKFLAEQARLIASETDKFVNSGQRSVIERYLVDAEVKDAETRAAEFTERAKALEGRLAIELGRPEVQAPECPDLQAGENQLLGLEGRGGTNPVLARSKALLQVAENRVDAAKATAMPLLQGIANGGYFANSQLKDKWNYAAGVGLSFPLFAGFRIDADIERATAEFEAAQAGFSAVQQNVAEADSRYDEEVQAMRVRLDFLDKENKLAEEAFHLAKKRYLSFQGTMVDLRDALKNYDRVRFAIDSSRYDWFFARVSRAIFHGVRAPE